MQQINTFPKLSYAGINKTVKPHFKEKFQVQPLILTFQTKTNELNWRITGIQYSDRKQTLDSVFLFIPNKQE